MNEESFWYYYLNNGSLLLEFTTSKSYPLFFFDFIPDKQSKSLSDYKYPLACLFDNYINFLFFSRILYPISPPFIPLFLFLLWQLLLIFALIKQKDAIQLLLTNIKSNIYGKQEQDLSELHERFLCC